MKSPLLTPLLPQPARVAIAIAAAAGPSSFMLRGMRVPFSVSVGRPEAAVT